jgi:hypothetical protein
VATVVTVHRCRPDATIAVSNPDRRRALELLAGSRYGYTKAILRAHGFSFDMMVELIKAGLATTKRERMAADSRQMILAAFLR